MLNNRQQSKLTIDDLFSPLFFFTREMFSLFPKFFIFIIIQNQQIHQFSHFLTSIFSLTTSISLPTLTLSILNLHFSPLFASLKPEYLPFPPYSNQQKSPSNQSKHYINQACHSFCQIATLPQESSYKYL